MSSDDDLSPAEKAARTRAANAAAKAGECVSEGCGHARDQHDANLTTCWADRECPCRGYRRPERTQQDADDNAGGS